MVEVETKGKGKKVEKKKEEAVVVVAPSGPDDPPPFYDDSKTQFVSRWVVPPFGSVQFKVRFRSLKEGRFDSSLAFEVVGTSQTVTLFCQGNCEVPKISTDPRSIFMRRVKSIPLSPQPPPSKRFCTAENCYSFGPLQLFKKAAWRLFAPGSRPSTPAVPAASPPPKAAKKGAPAEPPAPVLTPEQELQMYKLVLQTNSDVMRLTNDGRFKCTVTLKLLPDSSSLALAPAASGSRPSTPAPAAAAGGAGSEVFYLDWYPPPAPQPFTVCLSLHLDLPIHLVTSFHSYRHTLTLQLLNTSPTLSTPSTSIDLEEGETKEVRIWAFPESIKEYTRTVSLTVSTPGCTNPTPIEFPLSCHGVEPVR